MYAALIKLDIQHFYFILQIMETVNLKIKAMLVEKGITFSELGRSLDKPVTGQMISDVARGLRKSPRIRLAIARCLGVSVRDLFPDYKPAKKKSTPRPDSDSNEINLSKEGRDEKRVKENQDR